MHGITSEQSAGITYYNIEMNKALLVVLMFCLFVVLVFIVSTLLLSLPCRRQVKPYYTSLQSASTPSPPTKSFPTKSP